jgi:hypothetical protein
MRSGTESVVTHISCGVLTLDDVQQRRYVWADCGWPNIVRLSLSDSWQPE